MRWPDPILVTGTGRSGTTLTMRLLEAHGVWIGPGEEYCELMAIKRPCIYRPLARAGYDRYGVTPLPDAPFDPGINLRAIVGDALEANGYKGGPWAFKDAKILAMWPAWKRAFPKAKWVVALRDIACVVQSYLAFHRHDQPTTEAFVRAYRRWADELIRYDPIHTWVAWPELWIAGKYLSLDAMLHFLELEPRPQHYSIIERELWHHQPVLSN